VAAIGASVFVFTLLPNIWLKVAAYKQITAASAMLTVIHWGFFIIR
jgi:hypothetical protein